MNIRFGLYIIPEKSDFYTIGSHVVGFDIRTQQLTSLPSFIRPSWVASNTQFGFHSTITDAIITEASQLPTIIATTSNLLSCLKPENRYVLTPERIGFWRSTSNMTAIVMKPNRSVELLHDLLVTTLHPLGKGSDYFTAYTNSPEQFSPNTPSALQKTRQFYSPYIFDEFIPHFTCINSYDGPETGRAEIEQQLQTLFTSVEEMEFHSLALVVQKEGEPHFHIEREFSLHGE
jgi:hypothetical protein